MRTSHGQGEKKRQKEGKQNGQGEKNERVRVKRENRRK